MEERSIRFFSRLTVRGVICYWKENGGTLQKWGQIAPQFLKRNYDIIITDYREHGKSKGDISIENFYSDAQLVYDFLKAKYSEDRIIIIGYSLGTNLASHLASDNKPLMTILIDPGEKSTDKYLEAFFFPLPNINRFPFRNDLNIQKTSTPVVVISGTKSSLYKEGLNLKKLLRGKNQFFEIKNATHQSILGESELNKILESLLVR